MATKIEALAARDKFKEEFWTKDPENYNLIMISGSFVYDEETDDLISEDYNVLAYMFDLKDVENMPKTIDDVKIEYLPVISDAPV